MSVFKNIFSPKKTKYDDAKIREVFESGTSLEQEKMADYLGRAYWYIYKRGGKHLSDKEKRLDAYLDAISRFVQILKGETNTKVDAEKPLEALFRKVFKDKCTDHLRKKGRTLSTEYMDEMLLHNIQAISKKARLTLEGEYLPYIENDLLWEALVQLEKVRNECFEILNFWIKGYSYKEIAKFLGGNANANNVRANAHNCRNRVRELMDNMQS